MKKSRFEAAVIRASLKAASGGVGHVAEIWLHGSTSDVYLALSFKSLAQSFIVCIASRGMQMGVPIETREGLRELIHPRCQLVSIIDHLQLVAYGHSINIGRFYCRSRQGSKWRLEAECPQSYTRNRKSLHESSCWTKPKRGTVASSSCSVGIILTSRTHPPRSSCCPQGRLLFWCPSRLVPVGAMPFPRTCGQHRFCGKQPPLRLCKNLDP